MQRRVRAWHECYQSLGPVRSGSGSGTRASSQESLDLGWEIHAQIERKFPEWKAEKAAGGVFSDPALPFDISYHPDLWDEEHATVWEIKPSIFCLRNVDICVAELSGYAHFKGAVDAGFLLYEKFYARDGAVRVDGPWPWRPFALFPWERLRLVALESDALLLEREAAA